FLDSVTQIASLFGIYGLSILVVITSASLFYLLNKKRIFFIFFTVFITAPLWYFSYEFGNKILQNNPVKYTSIKLRLVQPSIKQSDKWSQEAFWSNFQQHIDLSSENLSPFFPDIIIWPESAVIVQPTYTIVYNKLKAFTAITNSILITGGVTDNLYNPQRTKNKIFASIYSIDQAGLLLFEYHKSHLVPFGEYVPFSDYISYMKKLTPGDEQYSPGSPRFTVGLEKFGLKIRPLLCYEIIFPEEVLMSNKDADFIMNLTNDGWYGDSSGPYQHFYMSKIRAIESKLPLVRVANNGISGVIDSFGRILYKTKINQVVNLDSYLPRKVNGETFYYNNKNKYLYIYFIVSFLMPLLLRKTD
ncbi:MAG: apolipoprotein N-acyltransferase, partial [Rickettsiaceae bacterium]|nr:apolipoprotein N-acyltransferase [Rickettsiaceae bacterium]